MPNKVGWSKEGLYLEVHPKLDDDAENQKKGMTNVVEMMIAATRDRQIKVNWTAVRDIYQRAVGVPLQISAPGNNTMPKMDSKAP